MHITMATDAGPMQVLLPLLLLIPLQEQPPAKLAEAQEPLLAGSAESLQVDSGAAMSAAAGLEAGGTAPLSMPETLHSPRSSDRSPRQGQNGVDESGNGPISPSSRSGGATPRRSSMQEPRRSFTFGSLPRA